MDKHSHFKIIDCGRYYVVENQKANDFDNYHTHLNKRNGSSKRNIKPNSKSNICKMLIKLICKKEVPTSDYLRESAKRISRDNNYIQKIDNKIKKDRDKQEFHKQPRGFF